MNCQIHFNQFDHSIYKPYILSCPHTICLDCLKRLTSKICPFCSEPVTNSYPNLALLELLPESEYDKNKTECIKVLAKKN